MLKLEGSKSESRQQGINLFRQHHDTIDIILLDIEMPVMNGVEVYRELPSIAPDMQVIFSSGRMPNSQVNDLLIHPNVTFLPKPYTGEQLTMEIEAALQYWTFENIFNVMVYFVEKVADLGRNYEPIDTIQN